MRVDPHGPGMSTAHRTTTGASVECYEVFGKALRGLYNLPQMVHHDLWVLGLGREPWVQFGMGYMGRMAAAGTAGIERAPQW